MSFDDLFRRDRPNKTLQRTGDGAAVPRGGAAPFANLVLGADRNLHGTTSTEGTDNAGTVFKISPAGILATIYNFCILSNCADGLTPDGALVKTSDGNFHGTTTRGGVYGLGSIFKTTPGGTLTTLCSLCAQGYPLSALMGLSCMQVYSKLPTGTSMESRTQWQSYLRFRLRLRNSLHSIRRPWPVRGNEAHLR